MVCIICMYLLLDVLDFAIVLPRRRVQLEHDRIAHVKEQIVDERGGQQEQAHKDPPVIDQDHLQQGFALRGGHNTRVTLSLSLSRRGVGVKGRMGLLAIRADASHGRNCGLGAREMFADANVRSRAWRVFFVRAPTPPPFCAGSCLCANFARLCRCIFAMYGGYYSIGTTAIIRYSFAAGNTTNIYTILTTLCFNQVGLVPYVGACHTHKSLLTESFWNFLSNSALLTQSSVYALYVANICNCLKYYV